jgi:outer membrane protein assembly factor BamB
MDSKPITLPVEPDPWPQAGLLVAKISGLFCLIVLVLLIASHVQGRSAELLDNKELASLKASLVKKPNDEALKKQVRELDLQLRQKHFKRTALNQAGGWLLLGGAIVFLLSYKPATQQKKLAKPVKQTAEQYARENQFTRIGISALGVIVAATGIALSLQADTLLTAKPAAANPGANTGSNTVKIAQAKPLSPFPSPEELKTNWSRFRGPAGSGISPFTNVPVAWDAKNGSNILWSVEVPISGPSSPVLWQDRIFLSGANATNREVYCFDTTGKLLWQQSVNPPRTNQEPPQVMEDSGGYGPSTPCTDGRRVYAIYANGDVAAFDISGTPAWARNLGKLDNGYGHATSLEMYQNRLIIQLDQGSSAKQNKSRILALDSATGQTVWETPPRPVPNSWATPIVINTGETNLLIACGSPWVMAYNPTDGVEIWRAKALSGEVLPSPVYSGGVVYVAIEGEKLNAIPVKGNGIITSNILWSADEGLPDIVGPLTDGERVYLVNSGQTATCYDAKKGTKLWDKEIGLAIKGSTTLVGDKIYGIGETGEGIVFQAAGEFKEIARNNLNEEVLATPAYADGRIYVRAKKHLFCIGVK